MTQSFAADIAAVIVVVTVICVAGIGIVLSSFLSTHLEEDEGLFLTLLLCIVFHYI